MVMAHQETCGYELWMFSHFRLNNVWSGCFLVPSGNVVKDSESQRPQQSVWLVSEIYEQCAQSAMKKAPKPSKPKI